MEVDNEANRMDGMRIPPIPLVSGNAVTEGTGQPRRIKAVTLLVSAEDGAVVEIALEYRYGGWWGPRALTTIA